MKHPTALGSMMGTCTRSGEPLHPCLVGTSFGTSLAGTGRDCGENWGGLQKSAACGKRCKLEGKLAASLSAREKYIQQCEYVCM